MKILTYFCYIIISRRSRYRSEYQMIEQESQQNASDPMWNGLSA